MFAIVIGSDIDGVINDLTLFHTACGTKYCYENNIPYNIAKNCMNSIALLQWSSHTDQIFWDEYYLQLLLHSHFVRPFVSEVTKRLIDEGHTLIFISARKDQDLPSHESQSMFKITTEYLKRNHIYYSDLILTQQKDSIIISKHVDIMIEDNPMFFQKFKASPHIPLLCFDTLYNEQVQGNNIIRVYSWYDILQKIHIYGGVKI